MEIVKTVCLLPRAFHKKCIKKVLIVVVVLISLLTSLLDYEFGWGTLDVACISRKESNQADGFGL